MTKVSVAEMYSRAGEQLISGQYPVHLDRLPKSAGIRVGERRVKLGKAAERFFKMPESHQHLAWWTHQAFVDQASVAAGRSVDGDAKYFSPGGPGWIGIFEMAKFLAITTNVYHKQSTAQASDAERTRDIRSIALRSQGVLRTVAAQSMPVGSRVEDSLYLKDPGDREGGSSFYNYGLYNHRYILDESPRGAFMRPRTSLDDQVHTVAQSYERDMARANEEPARQIGCFAMKISAGHGMDVFGALFHGTVLAGTTDSIVGMHLRELDKMTEGY